MLGSGNEHNSEVSKQLFNLLVKLSELNRFHLGGGGRHLRQHQLWLKKTNKSAAPEVSEQLSGCQHPDRKVFICDARIGSDVI